MDQYTPYVVAAYAATVVILGGLVLSSIIASRRARRGLERLEEDRKR